MERLQTIFLQMNKEQQEKQIVRFFRDNIPLSRIVPTKEQLASFKDAKMYGVNINGKNVNNEALNNYTNTDFALFYVSKEMVDANVFGKPVYGIVLMTNDYFQSYNDQVIACKKYVRGLYLKNSITLTKKF